MSRVYQAHEEAPMTTDNDAGTDKAQTIRRFFDAIVAGDSATLLGDPHTRCRHAMAAIR